MGLYDELNFCCPHCGEVTTYNTRSGPCCLNTYSLDDAPLNIIQDFVLACFDSTVHCEHCFAVIRARLVHRPVVIIE